MEFGEIGIYATLLMERTLHGPFLSLEMMQLPAERDGHDKSAGESSQGCGEDVRDTSGAV